MTVPSVVVNIGGAFVSVVDIALLLFEVVDRSDAKTESRSAGFTIPPITWSRRHGRSDGCKCQSGKQANWLYCQPVNRAAGRLPYWEPRKVSTARTRRWSSEVPGRRSFP